MVIVYIVMSDIDCERNKREQLVRVKTRHMRIRVAGNEYGYRGRPTINSMWLGGKTWEIAMHKGAVNVLF